MKTVLLESTGSRRAFRGQKAKFPQVEEKLCEYICDKRQFGFAISTEMCLLQAKIIAGELGVEDFKASRGWLVRCFERNSLSIRRRTTIAQRLPDAYEDKVIQFHRYVIKKTTAALIPIVSNRQRRSDASLF